MSDADVLAQTAEWLSRLADTIERVTEGLADSLARVQTRQNEQSDEIRALSNRVGAITNALNAIAPTSTVRLPGPRSLEP